jgi:hypothetical protein
LSVLAVILPVSFKPGEGQQGLIQPAMPNQKPTSSENRNFSTAEKHQQSAVPNQTD